MYFVFRLRMSRSFALISMPYLRAHAYGILCICLMGLAACSHNPPPISERSTGASVVLADTYTVKRGDTLYSIAFNHNTDFKELAKLNAIASDYRINVGQTLRLKPSANAKTVVSTRKLQSSSRPNKAQAAVTKNSSNQSYKRPVLSAKVKAIENKAPRWQWPLTGSILKAYSQSARQKKGLDIAAVNGQAVFAAAEGVVVYSGDSLKQYGHLLIIKHGADFLSAYAHNSRLLVKEGDAVAAGQKVALAGRSGAERYKLHFQIRKKGQPVNPVQYLPRR